MSLNKVNQTTGETTKIAGLDVIPIDSTPTENSTNAVQSGGTFNAIKTVSNNVDELSSQMQTLETAIDAKANKNDLASISITGTTNNTGSTISKNTFFYKSGVLVRAKLDIANGATLTQNTNYEMVTAGGLNELSQALMPSLTTSKQITTGSGTGTVSYTVEHNGLLVLDVPNTGLWIFGTLNGLTINACKPTGTSISTSLQATYPVKKGDIVIITARGSGNENAFLYY